jgi:hypothetical protein
MPAKYTLTIKEGKEKNYETIDFIGSGFTNNNNYVSLNIDITKLFQIAKDRPDLLSEYNGNKQIWINTNIKLDSSGTKKAYNSKPQASTSPYADELDDAIPFSPYIGV